MRTVLDSMDGLKKHLKWLASTGMLIVSLGNPVVEISSTIRSGYDIARLAEANPAWFGSGPYWVESTPHDHWEDMPIPELTYHGYAVAYSIEARLKRDGRILGGHNRLLAAIADYEYLTKSQQGENDDGMIQCVLVKLPTEPADLTRLKSILLEEAVFLSIDDGSGEIHQMNSMMGNGLKLPKERPV